MLAKLGKKSGAVVASSVNRTHHNAKNILIFGGTAGIGLRVAGHLQRLGHKISLASSSEINIRDAQLNLQSIGQFEQNLETYRVDLSSEKMISDFVCSIAKSTKFDGVIISSGILGPAGKFTQIDHSMLKKTLTVNAIGPALLIQNLLTFELFAENGKIILFSGGISGPDPFFLPYSISKHALHGFGLSLAFQLCGQNIWVNSVLPGDFHTKMNSEKIAMGPNIIGKKNTVKAINRKNENMDVKYDKLNSLIEWLLSENSNGVFGRLISAQHDNWAGNINRMLDVKDDIYRFARLQEAQ